MSYRWGHIVDWGVDMGIAWDVIGIYLALGIWGGTLAWGVRTKRYWPFLLFGLAIAVFLNGRYFVEGQADGIAYFVGIYDVFDNVGLASDEGAPALATCADNACTVWGDRFQYHPSWGVAFYERFADGPALRANLLYVHIALNTAAFLLMHYQVWRPGTGANRNRHRVLGRVTFGLLTLGTGAAVWLSTEHDSVSEYGGVWAMLGFWSMSAFVYGTAIMGARTARAGDLVGHRVWMIRNLGSMWGSFWLFRVMLVVTGPLLRNWEAASLQLSIWLSAPLGILIAEVIRRRPKQAVTAEPDEVAVPA